MTITIDHEEKEVLCLPTEEIIRDVVLKALEAEGCPYEAEVSVVLTDNREIQALNREYRGIDAPTDCFNPETGELILGDIILSVDKIREQAESYGHSQERELAFLIAHSMLHLCGYDHMEDEERKEMEAKQEKILELGGYRR